jgi:hypothetical protein
VTEQPWQFVIFKVGCLFSLGPRSLRRRHADTCVGARAEQSSVCRGTPPPTFRARVEPTEACSDDRPKPVSPLSRAKRC